MKKGLKVIEAMLGVDKRAEELPVASGPGPWEREVLSYLARVDAETYGSFIAFAPFEIVQARLDLRRWRC